MLAIRLGQSLPSSEPTRWMPTDEIRLEAWYRKGTGITFVGSNPSTVSLWRNESENVHHMAQATVSEQPTFETSDGSLTFDPTDDNNLQTTDQISLAGTFTIGVRIYISAVGGIILSSVISPPEIRLYNLSINFSNCLRSIYSGPRILFLLIKLSINISLGTFSNLLIDNFL